MLSIIELILQNPFEFQGSLSVPYFNSKITFLCAFFLKRKFSRAFIEWLSIFQAIEHLGSWVYFFGSTNFWPLAGVLGLKLTFFHVILHAILVSKACLNHECGY